MEFCFQNSIFFLSFRVVSHSGLQTYMLLYFRSKVDSCSWGHPTYTIHALSYVGLPISGGCVPPHHHGSSLSLPAPHGARPLDLSLRVVRFPAARTLHTQTAPASRHDTRNQHSPGAQWCTSHILAVSKGRHMLKLGGRGARANHVSHHTTAL